MAFGLSWSSQGLCPLLYFSELSLWQGERCHPTQSQLKIVCSLASSRANRSSVEILRESSSRWRHDPRSSLFVRIHALKFQSKPRGTFTGSGRLPLLFPCVAFAVSRGANVVSLDNPSAAFTWLSPRAEQGADTTAEQAAHPCPFQQEEVRIGDRNISRHSTTSPWTVGATDPLTCGDASRDHLEISLHVKVDIQAGGWFKGNKADL